MTGDLDPGLKGTPRERGRGTVRYLTIRELAVHVASPATVLPGSIVCGAGSLRASRCAPSSPCGRSSAAGQARLVSGNQVWAWPRDGLERPSPIEAPDTLKIESFKSLRIRGPAPKSQRG